LFSLRGPKGSGYLSEFIPASIGTQPRWFALNKLETLNRKKRQRTKLRRELRELGNSK
jgi:hypothetical protein